MFANLKLSVNYILLIISIILWKSCLCFHIHILPNNRIHNHDLNDNSRYSDNLNNQEVKPFENMANIFLSNLKTLIYNIFKYNFIQSR